MGYENTKRVCQMISLQDQMRVAQRQLAHFKTNSPVWIKSGRLTPSGAAKDLSCLEAIVATMDKLIGLEEVSLTMRGEWPKPKPEELFI